MKSLEVKNLSRSFGGLQAVHNLSFRVPAGEFTGLIGPNGSGKSTLFNLITGTLAPDKGNVLLDDHEIGALPVKAVFDRGVVRAFQVPRLFYGMSVLENVLAAAREQPGERLGSVLVGGRWKAKERELAERAYELLEFLNLAHVARNRASDLSGGQMKLLELARCLMADPEVLLLDEPAAGVVPKLAHEIFGRLRRYQQENGLTLIVIEHRLDLLFSTVDRVLVMNYGELIADGLPADVVKEKAVSEAYMGTQNGTVA